MVAPSKKTATKKAAPRKRAAVKAEPVARQYEVLVTRPNGHQTVHRVHATSEVEASRLVFRELEEPPAAPLRGKVPQATVTEVRPSIPFPGEQAERPPD